MADNFVKRPWETRWAKHADLPGGGQGSASVVKDRTAGDASPLYVLKLLKSQKDPERRGRMYREVASLRALKHSGVQKYVDSNADLFEKPDVPLYLVTEYIPGSRLSDFVGQRGPQPLASACAHVLAMLDILAYFHQQGVVHRDIKPDNIICQHDRVEDPV